METYSLGRAPYGARGLKSVIERCVELWSKEHEIVLDPFDGIGSTGYQAIKMGRRHVGIELKESYFKQAALNLEAAEREAQA